MTKFILALNNPILHEDSGGEGVLVWLLGLIAFVSVIMGGQYLV